MSSGNILPLMDDTGEPGAFGNRTTCDSGHVLAESSWADLAWLPGHANGLLDAGGTSVVLVGTVLAPALEPGLANGDVCPPGFVLPYFSWFQLLYPSLAS